MKKAAFSVLLFISLFIAAMVGAISVSNYYLKLSEEQYLNDRSIWADLSLEVSDELFILSLASNGIQSVVNEEFDSFLKLNCLVVRVQGSHLRDIAIRLPDMKEKIEKKVAEADSLVEMLVESGRCPKV